MGTGGYSILWWVLIIGVFYIFMILPERKKQKNMRSMIDSLKVGDTILTRGGIYGTLASITDDRIVIQTGPDNVRLEMSKLAIGSVVESAKLNDSGEVKEEKTEDGAGYKEVK